MMLTRCCCFSALIALIYLHTTPLKIYGRSFSWRWRTLRDLKAWIKEATVSIQQSAAHTWEFAKMDITSENSGTMAENNGVQR
ncbi:hypothetical protein FKM82_000100 [Ascaphus truei]